MNSTTFKNRLPDELVADMVHLPQNPLRPLFGPLGSGFARVNFPSGQGRREWPWIWAVIPSAHKNETAGVRVISPEAHNLLIKHDII